MIKQEIYLEKYDWNVIVCHVANQEDVDEAMDLLSSIDCKGQPSGNRYARRRTMLSYGMALSVDIIEDFLISLTWWADLGFFHLPSYKITRI